MSQQKTMHSFEALLGYGILIPKPYAACGCGEPDCVVKTPHLNMVWFQRRGQRSFFIGRYHHYEGSFPPLKGFPFCDN